MIFQPSYYLFFPFLIIFNSFFVCLFSTYIFFFSVAACSRHVEAVSSLLSKSIFFCLVLVWLDFGGLLLLYINFILPKFLFIYLHVQVSFMFKTSLSFLVVLCCSLLMKCRAIKQCLGTLYSLLRMGFIVQLSGQLEDPCYQYICFFFFFIFPLVRFTKKNPPIFCLSASEK